MFKKLVCGLTALIAIFTFCYIPVSAINSSELKSGARSYGTVSRDFELYFADMGGEDYVTNHLYNGGGLYGSVYGDYNFPDRYIEIFENNSSGYSMHTYWLDDSATLTYSSDYNCYCIYPLYRLVLSPGSLGSLSADTLFYNADCDFWLFGRHSADWSSFSWDWSSRPDVYFWRTSFDIISMGLPESTSSSIDVSVSPLSDDMSVDDNRNFVFKLTNTYDYPVQFIAYVSPFSSAVSADYAIKSLSGTGGVFVTEAWRYVLSQNTFVTANTVSSKLPAVMYIPKGELNLISKISDTCYDVTQFVPAGSSYSFSADWSNFCSIVPDTTYYFNVVACFLPESADKAFRDKSNDYSHYVSVYSQPFSFSSDVPDYKSPTDFVQTAPSESIDWDTTFNNYLNDTYGIDSDTFNTMIKNGDKFTNVKTGDKNIDADTVLANFNTLIGALGGVAGALGSVIDTGGLGFSSAVAFDDLLNLTNNPRATLDNTSGEITVIDKSKELSDYYNDYYNNQQVNNAPVFNNTVTVNNGSGSGTGTSLDIPDVDLEKYTSVLNKYPAVLSFVKTSMDFVPEDFWELAFLAIILSIFLLLIGRN